jgi:hypothetical protein
MGDYAARIRRRTSTAWFNDKRYYWYRGQTSFLGSIRCRPTFRFLLCICVDISPFVQLLRVSLASVCCFWLEHVASLVREVGAALNQGWERVERARWIREEVEEEDVMPDAVQDDIMRNNSIYDGETRGLNVRFERNAA